MLEIINLLAFWFLVAWGVLLAGTYCYLVYKRLEKARRPRVYYLMWGP